MKIYVATSWKNEHQPKVVKRLKEAGHDVYDFRNPSKGDKGFHWSAIDPNWKKWKPKDYVKALASAPAAKGFEKDMDALRAADLVVLVLPCGRSSHLEAGFAVGADKNVVIYYDEEDYWDDHEVKPELMNKMAAKIIFGLGELVGWVDGFTAGFDQGVTSADKNHEPDPDGKDE